MTRKWQSIVVGSVISIALSGVMFTSNTLPWLIYPAFPGISLIFVAIWFTDVHWELHPILARALVVAGNAAFYSGVCYVALRLRLRVKK
jgi:hypothetical protein